MTSEQTFGEPLGMIDNGEYVISLLDLIYHSCTDSGFHRLNEWVTVTMGFFKVITRYNRVVRKIPLLLWLSDVVLKNYMKKKEVRSKCTP